MSEEEFWKCTVKKFDALFIIHKQVNGIKDKDDDADCIDNVLF